MPANYITTETLTSGESLALSSIEITSIPHISIIDDRQNAINEIVEKYKKEIGSLLNEVYQVYKSFSFGAGYSKDISIELLWTTEPIKNQPYNAKIKLFLIVRSIDNDSDSAITSVEAIVKLLCSTLSLQKYDYTEIGYSYLAEKVAAVKDTQIRAIVKEEKVESLQNQLMPFCLTFDKLPISNNDLSRIVNVLIDYPNCAVSMQLIPTILEQSETTEIDRITQALETLSKGVMDQGIGNISFALAEKHAETYKFYSQHKSVPLFMFNILIYGDNSSISNISNKGNLYKLNF